MRDMRDRLQALRPPAAVTPLRAALRVFLSRDGRFLSAAIAFYALLSAVPLAYLALWVASLFVSRDSAAAALERELSRWTGPALAHVVARWEGHARDGHGLGVLSVLVLLYSATRLFAALERGLNAMWELGPADEGAADAPGAAGGGKRKLLRQLRTRGLAFVVATLLGVSLAALVGFRAGVAAAERVGARLAGLPSVLEWGFSLAGATLIFFLLYTVLPRTRARPRETLVGAAVSALLFLLGAHAITSYVAHKGDVGLGETLLVLLWLRYAAQVFLLGAATVGVYLRARGALVDGRVVPEGGAGSAPPRS
ncbi:MAG: YihY/virulence factor BrkB family protein [Myxococcales bacterium]|nr:YihY/virulence factor BrkB family protein [Myxococcales bacterium]HQY61234.1 YihY/virulence factor BrkB family protein [Polyangiaceae bacterium]